MPIPRKNSARARDSTDRIEGEENLKPTASASERHRSERKTEGRLSPRTRNVSAVNVRSQRAETSVTAEISRFFYFVNNFYLCGLFNI